MSAEQFNASDAQVALRRLEQGATVEGALAFFDSLPAVQVEEMFGAWKGSGLETGNPFDGLLEGMGWHGKRFRSADEADPLVMDGHRGVFCLQPRLIPLGFTVKVSGLMRKPAVQRLVRPLLPLIRTRKPAARLRMIEYRGVPTATMSYDALAVNDHFRRVDKNTLIGAMDLRAVPQPFMFVLRREGSPS